MEQPSPVLVTQWAVCGIVAAAARFVPVPLLDDVLRKRAVRVAVTRTLRAHDRDYDTEKVEPLWDDPDEKGRGLRGHLREVGTKIVLFPIRKYVAVFGAVRGVPTDVMRVVLLARALDRHLARGALATPDEQEARRLRGAVDTALDGMDLRMLTAGLSDGLSEVRDLTGPAVAYARRWVTREDPDPEPTGKVGEGAQRVTEVLDRPEIARLLDEYDAAVDAALA